MAGVPYFILLVQESIASAIGRIADTGSMHPDAVTIAILIEAPSVGGINKAVIPGIAAGIRDDQKLIRADCMADGKVPGAKDAKVIPRDDCRPGATKAGLAAPGVDAWA